MVDGALPEFFIESQGQIVQLTQLEHHATDGDGVRIHFISLFLQGGQFGLDLLVVAAQVIMGGSVAFFRDGVGSILFDTHPQHCGDSAQFFFQVGNIGIDKISVRKYLLGVAEPVDGTVPIGKVFAQGRQKQFFQALLGQMWRFALVISFEFAVALPDDTAVAVGGVPGFGTKNISAVAADNLSGERACLAVPFPAVFAPLQFVLNLCPCPRLYNGRVPPFPN